VRIERVPAVEVRGEAREIFAGQPRDQVDVQARVRVQPRDEPAHRRRIAGERPPAQFRERQIAGAGDQEVGVVADRLRIGLVADLGAAQYQREVRCDALQDRNRARDPGDAWL